MQEQPEDLMRKLVFTLFARRVGQAMVRYVKGIAQRCIAYRRCFDLNQENHWP